MIFEGIIVDQQKNYFTVRQLNNGVLWKHVQLASLLLFNPMPNEYVLCMHSDFGNTYIIGKIQGEYDDKYGYQIGNMENNLTITTDGSLLHQAGISETIITPEGCKTFYPKIEIQGYGWKIIGEEGKITISADIQSSIHLDANKIQLSDGSGGGIPIGNDYVKIINEIKETVNTLINTFNTHVHTGVTTGPGSSGPPGTPATKTIISTPQQSSKISGG